MRTLTVKLYNSDDFGYLGDMINIAGIIYNTALTIIQDHYNETGKLLDKYELQKQLRDLRNADENRHWLYVGSQAVQDGKDPGVVGTYLVMGEKATMYATLSDLSDFF